MHLGPRDLDKLILHGAGFLAQKRLARGLRLGYSEAMALIGTQLLELIRDGYNVSELMDRGRQILGRAQVLEGVPEMVHEVQVEGTFEDGTKLVTVHDPIALEQGDLELALYGSFLPVPSPTQFPAAVATTDLDAPGATAVAAGTIELNAGRASITIEVVNRGDRPIQVGSHYPFVDANPALDFDRQRAKGRRLDIPAGTAIRFEPGEGKSVRLIELVGVPLD